MNKFTEALSSLHGASAIIGMLPEAPGGYNGSILWIDDEEAARVRRDIDAAIDVLSAAPDLYEALQAVLPRLAHDAICASVRPSHEWAEHGSITFDNCCCGINQVKSALAKASP